MRFSGIPSVVTDRPKRNRPRGGIATGLETHTNEVSDMAKGAQDPTVVNDGIPNIPDVPAPEGWGTLDERYLYRPGPPDGKGGQVKKPGTMVNRQNKEVLHCGTTPIKGYPFARTHSKSTAVEGKDLSMLAIMLTAPSLGIEEVEGVERFVMVPAGKVLVVTETFDLSIFDSAADHPTHTIEAWIQPNGFRPLKGGRMMKKWTRKIGKQPVDRLALSLPSLAFFDGPDPFPELPEGQNNSTKALPAHTG